MELLFPGLAVFGASCYLTSLTCSFSVRLGRKPRWHLAVLGAASTGVLTWLFFRGGAGRALTSVVPYACAFSAVVGLIPAWHLVKWFRDGFTTGRRASRPRRVLGVMVGAAGAVALIVGVVSWLRVPAGGAERDLLTAAVLLRSVTWFLAGAGLSAVGFYVGLQDPKTDPGTKPDTPHGPPPRLAGEDAAMREDDGLRVL